MRKWILLFLAVVAFGLVWVGYAEPKTTEIYIVQQGDCLSSIAEKHGTTWQELWKLNPQIEDPELIYPKQEIRIKAKPLPPPLTREEKIERLALLMFKVSNLPSSREEDAKNGLLFTQQSFRRYGLKDFESQRKAATGLQGWTRICEIWILAESIVDLCNSDDEISRIMGLAWQESHFINRKGKLREVSFFQFLPSTIFQFFRLEDEIQLIIQLDALENNPRVAVAAALKMMRSYGWNWNKWNSTVKYEYQLNNKIWRVKKELSRR